MWGGIPAYRYEALQTIQNEAARLVTKRKWEVFGKKLLKNKEQLNQAGQLSVRQLASYHTMMHVKKILTYKQPEYLYRKLSENVILHDYNLRQRNDEELVVANTKSSLAMSSFVYRGIQGFNNLPKEIRDEPPKRFKKLLRTWVRDNIPITLRKGKGEG